MPSVVVTPVDVTLLRASSSGEPVAYDLVIEGGTIVDGTGGPPFRGDVGVRGDRIVAVGKVDSDGATRTIDAGGRLVTPGFVDVHTHLDAQLAWDPTASSSCWHGVTSVVLGNCGVTFAPCKPEDRDYLAEMMESVEDIPATSILEGLSWNWQTYGEYLDELDRLPKGVNVGGMVGHCAVRQWAMGERGLDQDPASDNDIAAMVELVDEAIAAGALGFSTSRTMLHRVPDGRAVPGTYAQPEELLAIAGVLGRRQQGTFEVAPRLGEDTGGELETTRAEVAWMAEVNRATGRPVTFGLAQTDLLPELHTRVLDFVDEAIAGGARLRPQTTARAIGILFGLSHRTPFDGTSEWRALHDLDLAARLVVLDDDDRRAELVRAALEHPPGLPLEALYLVGVDDARYDYSPDDSLAAHAERAGESAAEIFIRLARESDGRALFSFPFLNQRMDAVDALLHHPQMMLGLGDSGAHVGQIMDASLPTFFLSHWVRDRGAFSLEDGVRRLTSDTADVFGIDDRGVVQAGAYADLNVLDLEALRLPLPEYVHDFPGGAGRYVQGAAGYDATIVNGRVFMQDGQPTGELAGTVLRSRPE
jgi:N-acyl-D-amino-acid deacylase